MFYRYGNILHLTDGSKAGSYGSQTPMIQIWSGGFEVSSAIDSSPGAIMCINHTPPVKQWTLVEVRQEESSEKYRFNISIGEHSFSMINQRAEEFFNVQVFASSQSFRSQPGKIRGLRIESDLEGESLSMVPLALALTTSTILFTLVVALFIFKVWRRKRFGHSQKKKTQDKNPLYGLYFFPNGKVADVCVLRKILFILAFYSSPISQPENMTFLQAVENQCEVVDRSSTYGQLVKGWEGAEVKDRNPDYGIV